MRRLVIKLGISSSIIFTLVNLFYLNGCKNDGKKLKDAETIEGEFLVKKYCTSCHSSVSPQLLDNDTWQNSVLPQMGMKLGISKWSGQYFPEDLQSKISIVDWQKIVDYYSREAPKVLTERSHTTPLIDSNDFMISKPIFLDSTAVASTTMVKFDSPKNELYTADVKSNSLYVWNNYLINKSKFKFESPVIDVSFVRDTGDKSTTCIVTTIGIMNPVDNPQGKVFQIEKNNLSTPKVLADKLPRPVNSISTDINRDGSKDIIVCGFGHDQGGLYLLKQQADKSYSKVIISARAGATQTAIGDYNKDGWPDIICLFAQQDEGIWMYLNDQHGGFKSINLLKFPPVYGSSSFQAVDFNNDGLVDILYTAGDNSDYSKILKPYHGVYIFINKGNFKFKQTFFYPINGCTKAVAADLNKDGRLDLASIAFFADYKNNPRESFIYFMQNNKNQLIAYTLPIEKLGKWICMDVNDFDNDGMPDIALGNFSMGGFINQASVAPSWDTHLPFIILRNRIKKDVQAHK
ncbi:MAG: hypothetical protein JWN56_1814 [Sphingobacteriales bacterium]|nr:hypothetical protein [Sphingobacteriales bacterium]